MYLSLHLICRLGAQLFPILTACYRQTPREKMRLLQCSDTGEFSLTKDLVNDDTIPHKRYSDIEEVTSADLTNAIGREKPGYKRFGSGCLHQSKARPVKAIEEGKKSVSLQLPEHPAFKGLTEIDLGNVQSMRSLAILFQGIHVFHHVISPVRVKKHFQMGIVLFRRAHLRLMLEGIRTINPSGRVLEHMCRWSRLLC